MTVYQPRNSRRRRFLSLIDPNTPTGSVLFLVAALVAAVFVVR